MQRSAMLAIYIVTFCQTIIWTFKIDKERKGVLSSCFFFFLSLHSSSFPLCPYVSICVHITEEEETNPSRASIRVCGIKAPTDCKLVVHWKWLRSTTSMRKYVKHLVWNRYSLFSRDNKKFQTIAGLKGETSNDGEG